MEESARRPSVFVRMMNLAALVVTVLGALTIIDTIRNWLGG